MKVDFIGGDGDINLASGDVNVDSIVGGTLTVNSASGDVFVREAGSSVAIKTASGDLRLDSVARGEVNLQSASGDINVKVRRVPACGSTPAPGAARRPPTWRSGTAPRPRKAPSSSCARTP